MWFEIVKIAVYNFGVFRFSYIATTFVIEAMAAANALERMKARNLNAVSLPEDNRTANLNSSTLKNNCGTPDEETPLVESGLAIYT